MSSKTLNQNDIVNELKGSSLFFQREEQSPPPPKMENSLPKVSPKSQEVSAALELANPKIPLVSGQAKKQKTLKVSNTSQVTESNNHNEDASERASVLAPYPDGLIEEIRKTVKATGKEVSFVRLTPEEKNLLVDIVYTYKRQGVKTSENEINRIAVNYLLLDYKRNGAASLLTRVIDALLA